MSRNRVGGLALARCAALALCMSSWRAERLGRSSSRGMLHPCGRCRCGIAKHIPRPAIPANHWNWLSWKAHRPRRSTAGRLRATRAVLIGCQLTAGCHVQRRLPSRLPLPSRDGQRSACPAPGAALGARAAPWARRGGRRVRWRFQGARSEALAPKCFWTSYPFGTNLFEASVPHTTI